MTSLEIFREVTALAQELVTAEGIDPDRAMAEAIETLTDLQTYVTEWDHFASSLAIQLHTQTV